MPAYRFEALDAAGKSQSGLLEGDNAKAVRQQLRGRDLVPLTVTLDDADGPMPTAKLSALQEVEVIARLSESGNAIRQDGDLESKPVRVRLPATANVRLTLGAE